LLLNPMDTGDYTCDCDVGFSAPFCATWNATACRHFWYCDAVGGGCRAAHDPPAARCALQWLPGTAGHLDHTLAPFSSWRSARASSPDARLAELLGRQLQPWGAGYPPMRAPNFDYYFEANLLGNPAFPTSVKFVIAEFGRNFGTATGASTPRAVPCLRAASTSTHPV
jgi:hypothetical protein